ncbi:MAG: multidrug effflux MFS transporter [Simkaniaceae bacterium]|nr:MAG: multidrug effflux MFS transporter [Simkaniaceae bacterium]
MTAPVEPVSDKYRLNVKKPTLLTLIVLISYGSIGAALFTPAIPALMDRFGISASMAQLTVMIYLVGYSIGQLIYSPLAKRFGRKPALYTGIIVSLIGTFFCAIAGLMNSYFLLVASRFVSALGASTGLSLTFLIISDYFYEKHARKVTAYTMLSFAVIPGIAIAIGGFLVAYLGWESCFYFLFLYGIFALYLVYRLAETGVDREEEATKVGKIFTAYRRDFKNKVLILYSIMIGATTAIIYIFAATAPVIAIKIMGISPDKFGLLNLIPAAGYFFGNFVAARLASHLKIKTVLKLGVFLMGVGVLILATIFYGGWGGPLSLFLPLFIVYFGVPLFYSNAAVLATFRVPDKPNASSIMSFLNIGGAVIGLILIELLHLDPLYAMPSVFILIIACIVLLFRKGQKLIED